MGAAPLGWSIETLVRPGLGSAKQRQRGQKKYCWVPVQNRGFAICNLACGSRSEATRGASQVVEGRRPTDDVVIDVAKSVERRPTALSQSGAVCGC